MLKRSAAKRLRTDRTPASLMEPLENRIVFGVGDTPFPTMDMLEDPDNTVVRFQTNMGDIDIELFNEATPLTVNNFLKYVRDGDFDQSFFHRLAFSGANPFVLQGGGFRFDESISPAFRAIPTDAPVVNEAERSNLRRTLAMARTNAPDSATSQFFINLSDNTSLDPTDTNAGYAVFGRILGDASWNVVLAIQGLTVSDMRSAPQFQGQFNSNFGPPPSFGVPTTTAYAPGSNVTENILVRVNDAEIIKAGNVHAFYTVQVYYPEGFTGGTISEFLPMGNPGDTAVHYQVIVRSERFHGDVGANSGWFRDRVIDTGSLAPHSRGGITISQFGPNGAPGENDKVPQGVPYAIEVWSTGAIAANLSHYDFGTSTGEAFTPVTSLTWSFGEAVKNIGDVFDFLVWDNPNDVDANLTITFYFETLNPVTLTVKTDAYRRGGLAFENVAQIPDDTVFSAHISSDVPIIAALSHFDNRDDQTGSTTLGIPGVGSDKGVFPFAQGGADITDMRVSFYNPNNTPVVVTLVARFEGPSQEITLAPSLVLTGLHRKSFDLDDLLNGRIVAGDVFSIRFQTTGEAKVFGHASITALDDVVSNPFGVSAAEGWLFAEGFMDPARAGDSVLETMSVYNPNSEFISGEDITANVTFSFFYGDGHVITHTVQVLAGARMDLYLDEFEPILDEGTLNNRFFYSIRVSADVPIIAQMLHYDTNLGGLQASGGFSTLGTPQGPLTRLDDLNQ